MLDKAELRSLGKPDEARQGPSLRLALARLARAGPPIGIN
jgi:hypothetical protein